MSMERWRNNTERVKQKYSNKNRHNATLCTTNPKWTELKSNLGLCIQMSATNRQNHGTAFLALTLTCL